MNWNRSNAIGMARTACKFCQGNGTRFVRTDKEVPCHCVFRGVFRACLNRFRQCVITAGQASTVSLERCEGRGGHRVYSRKREEFMADFSLIAKRTLGEFEYRIFRYHFLLGADWRLCTRQMRLDRGSFFHTVYRIEQRLGRAFAETRPYSLYPLDEYFGGTIQEDHTTQDVASVSWIRMIA